MVNKKNGVGKPRPVPDVGLMLSVAHDYGVGAGVLWDAMQARPQADAAPGSYLILALLYLEILIKAFHAANGRVPPHGHDVLDLYSRLPAAQQIELEHAYQACRTRENDLPIGAALRTVGASFARWRYAYEMLDDQAFLPIVPLRELTLALEGLLQPFKRSAEAPAQPSP